MNRDSSFMYLPNGWCWTSLDECVDILDSQRIPINSNERKERTEGKKESELYPYYGATGQVDWIDGYIFDGEAVLLGEDGAPFLDPFKEKAYIVRGRYWVNNHAHVLKAISGLTTNSFICHYLNSFQYSNYVTGTTRYKLNQSSMKTFPVPIPPLKEQHRIVAKIEEFLTKLDAGVDYLKQSKKQLEQYWQAASKIAFEGKLTERWRSVNMNTLEPGSEIVSRLDSIEKDAFRTNKNAIPEIDDSVLHNIPEEWFWTNVLQISEKIQYGTSQKAIDDLSIADGLPVLRMGNIQNGELVFDDLKYLPIDYEGLEDFLLEEGDVLFNRTNSAELVGKTAVFKKLHPKSAFASYLIRIRTMTQFYNPYLLSFYVNSIHGKRYIKSVVSQQVGQANVNGTKLSMMPIPIMDLSEQEAIVDLLDAVFENMKSTSLAIDQGLVRTSRIRQSILSKAFSGKLVPQDQSDEQAEILLKRIKLEKESDGKSTERDRTERRLENYD